SLPRRSAPKSWRSLRGTMLSAIQSAASLVGLTLALLLVACSSDAPGTAIDAAGVGTGGSTSASTSSSATSSRTSRTSTGGPCGDCGDFQCCAGVCVNTNNDIKNCGNCGTTCQGAHPFCESVCVDPPCDQGVACAAEQTCCGAMCCNAGELCCALGGGAVA